MKKDLYIFKNSGASYSDVSIDLNNFIVDSVALTLTTDSDFLTIGLYKQFRNLFIDVKENTLAGNVAFEYYNGTAWQSLDVIDETKSLSRSGFVFWELPTDIAKTTINNRELYFIRVNGTNNVELNGVNMLFSNDNDLVESYSSINDYLGGATSFIGYHQSARKDIVQYIRNEGHVKVSSIDGNIDDLNVWDFMRPEQLRSASKYLVLSKIFGGVADSMDGNFRGLSKDFKKDYENAIETFLTTIDDDDDGVEDDEEQNNSYKATRIVLV